MRHWSYAEDEHSWQLFAEEVSDDPLSITMPLQIIKAPKKSKEFAEYWPSEKDSQFIIDALNRAELEKALTKED